MAVADLIATARTDADVLIQTGNAFLATVSDLAQFEIDVEPAPPLEDVFGAGRAAYADAVQAAAEVNQLRPFRSILPPVTAIAPASPTITSPGAIGSAVVPTFDTAAPTLNIPEAPSATLPSSPGSAPEFRSPAIPDSPSVTLPDAPSFDAIRFPEAPSVTVPSFIITAPIANLIAPTVGLSFSEEAYSSALLDAVTAKLLSDIEDGGYGIETDDEGQVWQRARDRLARDASSAQDEVVSKHASLGWPKPSGALFSDIERIRREVLDKSAELSNDIAVKRADLFRETRKFALEQSTRLEQITLEYHGAVQERALNAAKATIDAAIALFDASVKKYNFDLEVYKTEAGVFETRVRAVLAQVEIYRTQISAVEAQVGVQRNEVDIYKAKLSGVESIVNIYRERVNAANALAQIERTRLEGFRQQVEAYVAQVQAKTAEFGMYEARIRGETAKVTAFEAQVKAHSERVNTAKVQSDIDIATVRTNVERQKLVIDTYVANISKYRAELDASIAGINATSSQYSSDIQAYVAEVGNLLKTFDLRAEGNRLFIDAAKTDILDKLERARLRYQELLNSANVRMQAGGFGTNLIGGQITASLNTINTLAAQVESI